MGYDTMKDRFYSGYKDVDYNNKGVEELNDVEESLDETIDDSTYRLENWLNQKK
jgi:hypothetical protein